MKLINLLGYSYLSIVFITLILFVFGLRHEIKNNPEFVEKLTCERGGLAHQNISETLFIYKQDNDTNNCDAIISITEKTNKIWFPIFLFWFILFFEKIDFQKLFKE